MKQALPWWRSLFFCFEEHTQSVVNTNLGRKIIMNYKLEKDELEQIES